jgi:hypothetical protein
LGVVPSQAGTVAMAAYAAASLNATSVKVGFRTTDYDTAVDILQQSRRAMEGFNCKLVGSVFADNLLYDGGLDPMCMVQLAKDGQCDGWLIDTLTKDGRNLFDFITEAKLKEMVLKGKEMGMSTALSGHLKISDLDELARVNPDIVGVRGAVCGDGDRGRSVAWESVAEFKRQLDMRKTGEVNVFAEGNGFQGASFGANFGANFNEAMTMPSNGSGGSWVVIDGRGKSCAGVIAALARQMEYDDKSLVEAILADALNIYDVILWAEQGKHNVLNHRKDADGTVRVLIQP